MVSPFGLAVLSDRVRLRDFGATKLGKPGGDPVTSSHDRGNSRDYLLRRLKRDRPDLKACY